MLTKAHSQSTHRARVVTVLGLLFLACGGDRFSVGASDLVDGAAPPQGDDASMGADATMGADAPYDAISPEAAPETGADADVVADAHAESGGPVDASGDALCACTADAKEACT